jgi:hypothetical protein
MSKIKKDPKPLFVLHPDGRVTSDHWLLTIREAATALGVAPEHLRRLVLPSRKNMFPLQPIRLGAMVRFRLIDVISYIRNA